MEVVIKPIPRGKTAFDRQVSVIEDRTLSCTDVGVYMRLDHALGTDGFVDFYIDMNDKGVCDSLTRLELAGFITILGKED